MLADTRNTDELAKLAGRMRKLDAGKTVAVIQPMHVEEQAPPILLRPEQAAKLLGISEPTLRKWPIDKFSFGNVTGYRRADLENFVARHLEKA